ncbi:MAG: hypothetical protein U9N42_10605 [Campylobacterota bacterium]|nr:hypothetical protein [Campylobacterota bacterium]
MNLNLLNVVEYVIYYGQALTSKLKRSKISANGFLSCGSTMIITGDTPC